MRIFRNKKYLLEYTLVYENSQELILFFDMRGRILSCNRKALKELGYGTSFGSFLIQDIFKNVFSFDHNKLTINDKYLGTVNETIAYRKNQTCFPVLLQAAISSDKNKTVGICTAINITERKEAARNAFLANRELEEYQQARNEFVANITHELRTPVNGIAGLSDNLLDTELTQKQTEMVRTIKRCCNGMNTLINDLLDYAKISSNKLVLEKREFSFYEFIKQIVEFNKSKITEKGLKLLVNISNDIPDLVIGDEFRLGQILNNLFSNAIKFTSVGQIALEVVKLSQSEQYIDVFFMMIDTGIGIGVEEKEKIFQSFSQEDGSISRRFGGTGLGLSISKSLVEAMEGTIAVDSIKNIGSNFSFSVRLFLPNTSGDRNTTDYKKLSEHEYESILNIPEYVSEIPGKKMQDIMYGRLSGDLSVQAGQESRISYEEDQKDISGVLEKLSLCIELENWETAEELALYLKNLTNHTEIKKDSFRLLLAVRKESHDSSLDIIKEIRSILNEVN